MDFNKFAAPFSTVDIGWRVQRAGSNASGLWAMVLAYVTNRAIMSRLDDVCGPENWRNEFKTGPDGGVLCGISIYIDARNEWITKWDGADKTQVEAIKGGLSGAMKRAAVQWKIGRYLYNLDAMFANITDKGKYYQPADKKGKYKAFRWDPPPLPVWALPEGESPQKIEGDQHTKTEASPVDMIKFKEALAVIETPEDLDVFYEKAKTRNDAPNWEEAEALLIAKDQEINGKET